MSHQLSTLIREHATRDEPPFPDPSDVVLRGRRRVRHRRMAFGGVAAATVVLVGAVGVQLVDRDPTDPDVVPIDPAVQRVLDAYDAGAMPDVIRDVAEPVLGRSVEGLGEGEFAAYDAVGNELTPDLYDKASGMGMEWGERETTELSVALDHARGETEGDHERVCAADLRADTYFVCEVRTLGNGDVVIHRVGALRPPDDRTTPGWLLGNPEGMELADPTTWPARDDLWLHNEVEVIKSGTFHTLVSEAVKASTASADEPFQVPTDDLTRIAADPRLLLPQPPADPDGCGAWTLPDSTSQQACE